VCRGGWRLATRPSSRRSCASSWDAIQGALSQAARGLAIIAYRQPITLPEINFLRSVNSAGVIRTLVDRKLVAVAAASRWWDAAPVPHHEGVLVHFGLPDLSSLPSLEEVEHVREKAQWLLNDFRN